MASNQPAPLVFSTAFGLLMIAAAWIDASRIGAVVIAAALGAVLVGLRYGFAATLAVLFVIVAIVVSDPPPLFTALSGLSAAAYLVLWHASSSGVVTTTRPTVIGMLGFTLVGIVATAMPITLPWLPLLAPPVAVAIFVVATQPLQRSTRTDPLESGGTHAG
jgi:hypothetical protein